jgi:hypothetical protein
VGSISVGVTTAAKAGRADWARHSAEAAGVESEHGVPGQTLAGASPPNNLGFEVFAFEHVSEIEVALMGAGFGLGRQGTSRRRFYDLPNPLMAPPIATESNEPH